MPNPNRKPGFFRRLLGAKKEHEDTDEFEDDRRSHVYYDKPTRRSNYNYKANHSFVNDENINHSSYHSNKVSHPRRGTKSCAAGRGLDEPASDSDDDTRSIHTEVLQGRSSRRHRKKFDEDDSMLLRESGNRQKGDLRSYMESEIQWSRKRIALLEAKVESVNTQLYKVSNKYTHENNRYNELSSKYQRLKSRYDILKAENKEIRSQLQPVHLQPSFMMNQTNPLMTHNMGTPSTFANRSLFHQTSSGHVISPPRQIHMNIPRMSHNDNDSIKDFRGGATGAEESLLTEASTSRISNSSFIPPIFSRQNSMSMIQEEAGFPSLPSRNDDFNRINQPHINAPPNFPPPQVKLAKTVKRPSSN